MRGAALRTAVAVRRGAKHKHFVNNRIFKGKQGMKTIEVVAAIIEHEGRILATQRGYGDFKDGWEFPGGKMEPGETPEAAIVREIEEELKVTISPKTLVTTVECDYPKFHLTMHCFLASIVKGEICLVEHEAAKWLAPANSTASTGCRPTWRSWRSSRSFCDDLW